MKHFNAVTKHHILLEYTPHDKNRSFSALALRHSIPGGKKVVRDWYRRWNGTELSLHRKKGSGKQCLLSRAQIARHIGTPIRAANRSHRAIHYSDLLDAVRAKTRKQISIQTIRRYGKEILHGKNKHTDKRTKQECKRMRHKLEELHCCMV